MTQATQPIIIVLAQLNFTVGDITANSSKIIAAAQRARDEMHADMIIFPELALSGYPPEDLVQRSDFTQAIQQALNGIATAVPDIIMLIGYPELTTAGVYNSAAILQGGKQIANHQKQKLPNYGVFDEKRYFQLGSHPTLFTCNNIHFAVTLCEDLWFPEPISQAKQAGAQVVISLNASPFDFTKPAARKSALQQRVQETHLPIIYVNLIGGQDDLVFDGNSFVLNQHGEVCAQAAFAQEQLLSLVIQPDLSITKQSLPIELTREAQIYQAITLSVHDYVIKNGFKRVLLGLSGGVDSALTLAIAVDALGKDYVQAVLLPSRYTSTLSVELAQQQLAMLDVHHKNISIEPLFSATLKSLNIDPQHPPASLTTQNIQARCRAIILMSLSNEHHQLLLNTGNKSEMAVGYCTLYGDMAGAFAVLKDVFKTDVYRLAHYRNNIEQAIPLEIIERAPTAELAPNQRDEDNIPPYDNLDKILHRFVEADQSIEHIIAAGFDEQTVRRVVDLVYLNEYKRRQSPPGPKISPRAFGRERRFPITSGFKKR
jgi:NAD+ synthase (glutamine-hydrolysing)